MKTDQTIAQPPMKSQPHDEQTTPVMHRSDARQSAQHYPKRSGGSTTGNVTQEEQWAYRMGWFGIGLGLTELMAPRRLARGIGAPSGHEGLIRMMGLREIASGMGILIQRKPITAIWSRVVGDVIDLALLSAAFASPRSDRGRLVAATTSVIGAMVMDLIIAQQLSRGVQTREGMTPITAALIIDRPREDLYRQWRNLSNLPQFMKHLERIDVKGDHLSHWVATGPAGSTVEWDAEITEDRSNECIAWRSVDGSEIDHAGSVQFEPAPRGRGTLVRVNLEYRPPLGTIGAAVSAWFGKDPSQTVKMDLRRFKQVMETGDVITTEGQPAGRKESTSWKYDTAMQG